MISYSDSEHDLRVALVYHRWPPRPLLQGVLFCEQCKTQLFLAILS